MSKIEQAAEIWQKAKNIVVLSGAGMSTASGLPDFRSKTGLWQQRPEALATLNALYNTPDEFYFFYQWRIARLWQIEPNAGHIMLSNLEKKGLLDLIVTQNVDGLHQRAGSKNVAELHGTLQTVSCIGCKNVYDSRQLVPTDIDWETQTSENYKHGKECFCASCGKNLRPNVVLFGEQLPVDNWQKSVETSQKADLLVVLGSSLLVGPANLLPNYTLDNGGKLIIINNDPTHLDAVASVVINEDIPTVLAAIEKQL
jgi:NAD-dependent protein deacetylases, SIR2 family